MFILRVSAIDQYVQIANFYKEKISSYTSGRYLYTKYSFDGDIGKVRSGLGLIPTFQLFDVKTQNILYSLTDYCINDKYQPYSVQDIERLFADSGDSLMARAGKNLTNDILSELNRFPEAPEKDLNIHAAPEDEITEDFLSDIFWVEDYEALHRMKFGIFKIGYGSYFGRPAAINGVCGNIMEVNSRRLGISLIDWGMYSGKTSGAKYSSYNIGIVRVYNQIRPFYHIDKLNRIIIQPSISYEFYEERAEITDFMALPFNTGPEYLVQGICLGMSLSFEFWPNIEIQFKTYPGNNLSSL